MMNVRRLGNPVGKANLAAGHVSPIPLPNDSDVGEELGKAAEKETPPTAASPVGYVSDVVSKSNADCDVKENDVVGALPFSSSINIDKVHPKTLQNQTKLLSTQ